VPPLIELAARGDEAKLVEYLQQGGSIDAVSDEGETLICEAISHLNFPMVKACIEHGASLKATIHAAIRVRSPELLDLVIAGGANPFDLDRLGRPATSDLGGTALPGEFGRISRSLEEKLHAAMKRARS
jgi:ankyrin repeat protein